MTCILGSRSIFWVCDALCLFSSSALHFSIIIFPVNWDDQLFINWLYFKRGLTSDPNFITLDCWINQITDWVSVPHHWSSRFTGTVAFLRVVYTTEVSGSRCAFILCRIRKIAAAKIGHQSDIFSCKRPLTAWQVFTCVHTTAAILNRHFLRFPTWTRNRIPLKPGLPDGLFSNPKNNLGKFWGPYIDWKMLIYFMAI
jgi:hypothetical protein